MALMRILQSKNELKFNQVLFHSGDNWTKWIKHISCTEHNKENEKRFSTFMMETRALTLVITTTKKVLVFDVLNHFKMNWIDRMESKPKNYR